MNKAITSREVKFILKPIRFNNLEKGIESFLQLIESLVEKQDGDLIIKNKKKIRKTYFLDTASLEFYQNNFIIRVREEKAGISKITLKFRHPDRYLAASKDMSSTNEGDCKFEEDILSNGSTKFSHSISVKMHKPWSGSDIKIVGDLANIFPLIDTLAIPGKSKIQVVNNFKAYEVAYDLGCFYFDENRSHGIKSVLCFWYSLENKKGEPLIVEFSFSYSSLKNEDFLTRLEEFPIFIIEKTNLLVESLKKQTNWVADNFITKTNYAYK